jgi:hypothetical protein
VPTLNEWLNMYGRPLDNQASLQSSMDKCSCMMRVVPSECERNLQRGGAEEGRHHEVMCEGSGRFREVEKQIACIALKKKGE